MSHKNTKVNTKKYKKVLSYSSADKSDAISEDEFHQFMGVRVNLLRIAL